MDFIALLELVSVSFLSDGDFEFARINILICFFDFFLFWLFFLLSWLDINDFNAE